MFISDGPTIYVSRQTSGLLLSYLIKQAMN